jgi:putative sterol carrier protein
VSVKFLSEEWTRAVTEALNGSEAFTTAAGGQSAKIQQVVNAPDGEVRYHLTLDNGRALVALGDVEGPDATVTQDYETAVALAKNELNGVAAFMSGKLQISGDLMRLMQLQGALGALAAALKDIDVEY